MTRETVALSALAVVICTAAGIRAGVLVSGSFLPAEQPVPTANPLPGFPSSPAPRAAWSRSLFSRPGSAVPVNATDDPPTTSSAGRSARLPRLIGVIINQKNRIAIFGYDGTAQRVNENEKIGEWLVTRIDRRSATLQSGSASRLVELDSGAR